MAKSGFKIRKQKFVPATKGDEKGIAQRAIRRQAGQTG